MDTSDIEAQVVSLEEAEALLQEEGFRLTGTAAAAIFGYLDEIPFRVMSEEGDFYTPAEVHAIITMRRGYISPNKRVIRK